MEVVVRVILRLNPMLRRNHDVSCGLAGWHPANTYWWWRLSESTNLMKCRPFSARPYISNGLSCPLLDEFDRTPRA